MKITHILYSGLGGHGNVFFSFVTADEYKHFDYEAIFAGVEEVRQEYITKCTTHQINWKFLQKKRGVDIGFARNLVATVKGTESSVIFLHGSRFIFLAKLAALLSKNKKKIVVRETQANHLKTGLEWLWLALTMLFADRIIFLTDNFKEEVRKILGWVYSPRKISIINNGIDLNFFKPLEKPPAKTIVLGMQSRIVPIKDHATLLQAVSRLQLQHPELKVQLKIAGDGDSLKELQMLAKQLQIEKKVLFTGMLNESNLVSFMQSLDIYIHASHGETMSTSIMQAMACKLPIIASDVPGISNMIENNKTGILVPPKNQVALAKAIADIINNPAKATTMKEAAFEFAVLNYSNKTMFAKYQSVFENMI
jgi:glycosyltransferase involved in cell wall biosynthesis